MKEHQEVRWSEVARRAVIEYLQQLKGESSSKEIADLLDYETRHKLKSITEEEAKRFYRRVVEAEWKRAQ